MLFATELCYVGQQQVADQPAANKNMDVSGEEANDALSKETHQSPDQPATDQYME